MLEIDRFTVGSFAVGMLSALAEGALEGRTRAKRAREEALAELRILRRAGCERLLTDARVACMEEEITPAELARIEDEVRKVLADGL